MFSCSERPRPNDLKCGHRPDCVRAVLAAAVRDATREVDDPCAVLRALGGRPATALDGLSSCQLDGSVDVGGVYHQEAELAHAGYPFALRDFDVASVFLEALGVAFAVEILEGVKAVLVGLVIPAVVLADFGAGVVAWQELELSVAVAGQVFESYGHRAVSEFYADVLGWEWRGGHAGVVLGVGLGVDLALGGSGDEVDAVGDCFVILGEAVALGFFLRKDVSHLALIYFVGGEIEHFLRVCSELFVKIHELFGFLFHCCCF